MDICPSEGIPRFADRYQVEYWLRDWELTRKDCGQIIVDAGLWLPPKSACWFCPAMKKIEILTLREEDPELYAMAIEMERLYREGPHFRGDRAMKVTAVHKTTGEKVELDVSARSKVHAREIFRWAHDDVKKPHNYRLSVTTAVRGLGRNFAWSTVEEDVA